MGDVAPPRLKRLGQHLAPHGCSGPSSCPVRHSERTIVNAAEHVFLMPTDVRYSRFPHRTDKRQAGPETAQRSLEQLLERMKMHSVDKVMISHVVYMGQDNSYTAHCIKSHPDKFTATGLLVGDGLLAPDDPTLPARLEELVLEQGFSGLRLSAIFDKHKRWLDDPGTFPLWAKAEGA